MAVQIQLRNDLAANWTAANPTLAIGEIGVESDTNSVKVGDGSTAWNSLDYFGVSSAYVTNQINNLIDSAPGTLDTLNEIAAAIGDDENFITTVNASIDAKAPLLADFVTDSTTARTVTSSDAHKTILFTSGSDITITVDASTDFPVGARMDFIQDGAGIITVTASGATVAAAETSTTSGSFTIGAQYSAATLLCVGTDSYRLIGNIAAV